MSDRTMHLLGLLIATMAVSPARGPSAEALPTRALARLGDHRFYHGSGITSAVLSPDGRRIASADFYPEYRSVTKKERDAYDPIIVVWDAATGERLRGLRVPHVPIEQLAFAPDGKLLAAVCQRSADKSAVVVFEVESGKLLWQREGLEGKTAHLQFSANGKQVRVSAVLGPVRAWEVATGKPFRTWKPPAVSPKQPGDAGVQSLLGVLSPDGKVLVWERGHPGSRHGSPAATVSLRFHDAATHRLLFNKSFADRLRLESIRFSADGRRIAARQDGRLLVWDTADGKEVLNLEVPDLVGFVLSPDGRHAVFVDEKSRAQWLDLETGKVSRELYPGFIPLNRYLLETPQLLSSDGRTLLLAHYGTLRLFDARTGKERVEPGHHVCVTPRFSADGRTLFTSCGERRRSWDVSGKEPRLLKDERKYVWEIGSLAYSSDDRLFLDRSADQSCARVRETATGRILRVLEDSSRYWTVNSGRFSPDATRVCLRYGTKEGQQSSVFRLRDAKTGKALGEFNVGQVFQWNPLFSPNSRLIPTTENGRDLHLRDAATGRLLRTLHSTRSLPEANNDSAKYLFSPDSDYLFEHRLDLPMRIFHLPSGREITRFSAGSAKEDGGSIVTCMACSPDNRLLAVAEYESGIVRLIEIASGRVRAEFTGHRHGVHGLAFAPDGKTLASGGQDNVVFLWDVTGARTRDAKPERDVALPSLWNDLASEDGKRAGDAIASMLRKPQAVAAFLREKLHPIAALDEKRLSQLLADLDAAEFAKREAASRELIGLGERVEEALRRALANRPSLEMRRRIEDILGKRELGAPPTETLRTLRAIEVLEHSGTAETRRCLEVLAKGAEDARPTREAQAALRRLAKRRE